MDLSDAYHGWNNAIVHILTQAFLSFFLSLSASFSSLSLCFFLCTFRWDSTLNLNPTKWQQQGHRILIPFFFCFSRSLWGDDAIFLSKVTFFVLPTHFLCLDVLSISSSPFLFLLFVPLPPFLSHILSFSFLFLLQLVVLSLSLSFGFIVGYFSLSVSVTLFSPFLFLSSSVVSLSFFFCLSVCFSLIFFSLCLSSLISNAGLFTRVGKFLLWSNLSKITFCSTGQLNK